jgi:hypothetical protein
LVFNLGEAPPLEAFSNLLWVLILGGFELMGLAAPTVAPLLSLLCFGGLVVLVGRDLIRSVASSSIERLLFGLAFMTLPPLVVWATSGLATMPFALVLYCLVRSLGGGRGAPWWAALCILLRVDGFVFVAAVLAVAALQPSESEGEVRAGASWGQAAGVALLTLGGVELFRRLYFGTWLPHTAVVKVAVSPVVLERGARYILAMLVGIPGLALLLLLGVGSGMRRTRVGGVSSGVLLAPLVVVVALALAAGGDFMAFGRFFVPAIAPLYVLVLESLRSARIRASLALTLVALNGACFFSPPRLPAGVERVLHFRWNESSYEPELVVWKGMEKRARLWAQLGRALALETRPGETIVLGAIGAVGYYSDLTILDQYGLVDRAAGRLEGHPANHSPGHDKQVLPGYYLPRRPDYFLGTELVPKDTPNQGLPASLLEDPFVAQHFELEFHEVQEGVLLRLVRPVWPSAPRSSR